jgi:hypothetical protein
LQLQLVLVLISMLVQAQVLKPPLLVQVLALALEKHCRNQTTKQLPYEQ